MAKKIIGILTPHMDGFYFNGILQGIHQAACENNINTIYFQTQDTSQTNVIYHRHLGIEYVDGWIVLLNAVKDPEYIERMEAMGKPVICTPYTGNFKNCTTFIVDNEQGGYDATSHMIQHGHMKIAFIHCLNNEESMLRYKGYLRALQNHGISYDPDLVFNVPDLEDKNHGIEVVRVMQQRGFGFTSIVISADLIATGIIESLKSLGIHVPENIALFSFDNIDEAKCLALSSVEQPLVTRGKEMCEMLIKQMEGPYEPGQVIQNRMGLVYRHSCGCEPNPTQESIEVLYNNELDLVSYLSNVIKRNHHLGGQLIKSNVEKIKDLSWLSYTTYTWGCLALWTKDRHLRIESIYSTKSGPMLQVGQQFTEEAFPPSSLHANIDNDETLTVHTIRTEARELGFILLLSNMFDKFQKRCSLIDSIAHSLNLLEYALEREALYEEVRQRENRLEIVSSTTNDGIFDWDLSTDMMEWNRKINHILDNEGLMMHIDDFILRIHPDDLSGFQAALAGHYQNCSPFQIEFRMQKKEGEFIWISAAGEAVRNQEGEPVRMIGSIVDITERKRSEEKVHFIAFHDALTGLPNRRYIYDRITEEVAQADRPFAVIMLDVDRFKTINDSLGHAIGDQLLCKLSFLLQSSVGPKDIVARLGGDEFIIVCTDLEGLPYAQKVARQILDAFNVPLDIEGHTIHVTASIGISYYPEHGRDRGVLMKHADIALYQAKENGKNRFHIYRHDMSFNSLQKLTMEGCLRGALKANEFELHYQPQIDLSTGAIVGMEALIRWFSPVFGKVSPNDFIPLAEEMGLIIPISEWVCRQACMDTKHLLDEGFPPLVISVNISASHLAENSFVENIKSTLLETGLPPHLLCVEITERAAIEEVKLTIQHLSELMDLGVRIALDDFGVGNSSLSLVKTLPLDIIKIDRMFIKDTPQSEISTAIFSTILGLITDLRLDSCAEGIETSEQYELAQKQQCRFAQGFHICKPVSFEELKSFLSRQPGGSNKDATGT
ncbi:MAG: EAL domain-containing protein [Clostridia bacterium]|nr:EAL domain-containing protein [Clostridia bacterium]